MLPHGGPRATDWRAAAALLAAREARREAARLRRRLDASCYVLRLERARFEGRHACPSKWQVKEAKMPVKVSDHDMIRHGRGPPCNEPQCSSVGNRVWALCSSVSYRRIKIFPISIPLDCVCGGACCGGVVASKATISFSCTALPRPLVRHRLPRPPSLVCACTQPSHSHTPRQATVRQGAPRTPTVPRLRRHPLPTHAAAARRPPTPRATPSPSASKKPSTPLPYPLAALHRPPQHPPPPPQPGPPRLGVTAPRASR